MAIANKIYSGGKRVLQKRNSAQQVVFNDADIVLGIGINKADRTTVGSVTVTFDQNIDIFSNWQYGANTNLFKENLASMSVTKNLNINEDNNGAGNGSNAENVQSFFYLKGNLDLVNKITISQSSNGIQSTGLLIFTPFANLKELINNIPQSMNWLFLDSLPSVEYLTFVNNVTGMSNLLSLKNSNLKALQLSGYNLNNINSLIQNLPTNLYYFRINGFISAEVELSEYFTGNRVGFVNSTLNGGNSTQYLRKITYAGGAIFPSILTEGKVKVDYIFRQLNNAPDANKLTATECARFIVDLANQVTAVNLTQKRINFGGIVPDSAYVDNSKPLYKTYSAAENYVKNTLGITIS